MDNLQSIVDGLIALVVVASNLIIMAQLAFIDIFKARYLTFYSAVVVIKWLAIVLLHIDIPDVIYLLVFIYEAKPQATWVEKIFYAFFPPLFWIMATSFFSFYLFKPLFNQPIDQLPYHLGALVTALVVLPLFLGLQHLFSLDTVFRDQSSLLDKKYKQLLFQLDIGLVVYYVVYLFKQELFSLLINEIYLPSYSQFYIWLTIALFVYILIRFVSYVRDLREAEILQEQQEHLRNLEAYNQQIEMAYKSVRSFKHDYENILISMQSSIDSGDFELINQTYRDILKKAGQEMEEDDHEVGTTDAPETSRGEST